MGKGNNLKNRIKKVKMFVCDADGVLTDGKIILDDGGNEWKEFNVLDGAAFKFAKRLGYKIAVISGRKSKVIELRAGALGVDFVFQNVVNKLKLLEDLLKKEQLKMEEVCYIGDDLVDIPVLKNAGLAVAVLNAVPEVTDIVDYVTKKRGGEGAVRETIELVLKGQGRWKELLSVFDG